MAFALFYMSVLKKHYGPLQYILYILCILYVIYIIYAQYFVFRYDTYIHI